MDYTNALNDVLEKCSDEASEHPNELLWFKSKVTHKGDWDIKVGDIWEKQFDEDAPYPGTATTEIVIRGEIATPEDMGNILYGYSGSAADFTSLTLIYGTLYAGKYEPFGPNPVDENEMHDQTMIKKGVDWYKNK